MSQWWILLGLGMTTPMAYAACNNAAMVRDPGLRRAWRVERDCRQPQRPAVLVEVPWTSAGGGLPFAHAAQPPKVSPPEVRSGMQVQVIRHQGDADVGLTGTALHAGRRGERIAIRTTWRPTILYGVVRGVGWVEMQAGKGGE